ncbi:hypothetical protein [Streptomyces sp. NPDC059552]|uniref:hypothetical protein n=1 Tax=Streptomyces sp. NPDC059552 TaxID=3346862 RepID=UPI00369BD4A1
MIRSGEEHGLALTLDGAQIATGSDIEALRGGGLSELRVRAALAGRPVLDAAEHPAAPAPAEERPAPPAPPTPAVAMAPPAPAALPALLESDAYRGMWAAV